MSFARKDCQSRHRWVSRNVWRCLCENLAFLAGLTVCDGDQGALLLTDDPAQIHAKRVLWIQQGTQALPKGVKAKVDLTLTPGQLREAIAAVARGESWGIDPDAEVQQMLSDRELEMMTVGGGIARSGYCQSSGD